MSSIMLHREQTETCIVVALTGKRTMEGEQKEWKANCAFLFGLLTFLRNPPTVLPALDG